MNSSTIHSSSRKNIIILSLTMAVVMLGFGIVMPVFPFYIESMGASGDELGLLVAISPFVQLVFSPIWGEISDRKGRKPVLAIGILGYGISMVLFGLATELWMLFVIRAFGGILSAATLPTTYAYISDSTSEEDRGGAMGILGAATGLGVMLGPGLGGWLATDSLSTPFFITAGFCMATLFLIWWLLPESLSIETRHPAGANPRSTARINQLWRALFSPIGTLLIMAMLVSFGLSNFQGIFGLYALEKYGYGPEQVGWILTVVGIVSAVTQGALTGRLTRRWGEAIVIKITLPLSAAGFILMLVANTLGTVLVTIGLFTLPNALLRPAVISLTSKRATVGEGVVMGLNNSFTSLGRIIGPLWAGLIFDVNYDLPYLSGAIIMFVGFLISLVWIRQVRGDAADAAQSVSADQYAVR